MLGFIGIFCGLQKTLRRRIKMSKCHYCGESFYLLAKEGFIKKPISVKFRYEDIIETFQFCDEECTECFEQDQYVLNQGY